MLGMFSACFAYDNVDRKDGWTAEQRAQDVCLGGD